MIAAPPQVLGDVGAAVAEKLGGRCGGRGDVLQGKGTQLHLAEEAVEILRESMNSDLGWFSIF